MFKKIRKEQGLTSEYVFTYGRRVISRSDRAFKDALEMPGIEDFTFHDLRQTFASHLVMRGASMKEVQELLGHKKKAVRLLNGLTSVAECHRMSQSSNPARAANG